MRFPAIGDTIIAVSSGWGAAELGIVRLSGAASFELPRQMGVSPHSTNPLPHWTSEQLLVDDQRLPALVYWFSQPRSYTGQDLVELHTPGCLPLLRRLCELLIEQGARRALPGEFTARAFLAGKINVRQAEDVLALISADNATAARQARRGTRIRQRVLIGEITEKIVDLLAMIEASIDFADEEDVHIVTASEACAALAEIESRLDVAHLEPEAELQRSKPHVALAGLPNAGKSTLFNALSGYERAIVSPVLGTTRDVLSVELKLAGVEYVLQDCAGLGQDADELELAAHLAAERAADQADFVLWMHAVDAPWHEQEIRAAERIDVDHRLLVWSKIDLITDWAGLEAGIPFNETLGVSAVSGAGLEDLRQAIGCLFRRQEAAADPRIGESVTAARVPVHRARALVEAPGLYLATPELVAFELRSAHAELSPASSDVLVEDILGRVFSEFCVGK
ncbi:MAG: GTPase [Planctomycetota bacterium]